LLNQTQAFGNNALNLFILSAIPHATANLTTTIENTQYDETMGRFNQFKMYSFFQPPQVVKHVLAAPSC